MPINHKPVHVRSHVRAGSWVRQHWRSLPTPNVSVFSGSSGGLGVIGTLFAILIALGLFPLVLLYVAFVAYRKAKAKEEQPPSGYSMTSIVSMQRYELAATPSVASPLPYTPAPLGSWIVFWLSWTLMNGLGWAAAAVVPALAWATHASASQAVIGFLAMTLVIGLAQWIVLRGSYSTVHYWIPATLIGFIIAILGAGMGLSVSLFTALFKSIDGHTLRLWDFVLPAIGVSGLLLGIAQQRAIRTLPTSGWWSMINASAWCVGAMVFLGVMQIPSDAVGILDIPGKLVTQLLEQRILALVVCQAYVEG